MLWCVTYLCILLSSVNRWQSTISVSVYSARTAHQPPGSDSWAKRDTAILGCTGCLQQHHPVLRVVLQWLAHSSECPHYHISTPDILPDGWPDTGHSLPHQGGSKVESWRRRSNSDHSSAHWRILWVSSMFFSSFSLIFCCCFQAPHSSEDGVRFCGSYH